MVFKCLRPVSINEEITTYYGDVSLAVSLFASRLVCSIIFASLRIISSGATLNACARRANRGALAHLLSRASRKNLISPTLNPRQNQMVTDLASRGVSLCDAPRLVSARGNDPTAALLACLPHPRHPLALVLLGARSRIAALTRMLRVPRALKERLS